MNNQSLVSIVIPCYKGEDYLAEAIESCLHQTYQNIEIIVVDDASPDHCAEIAERHAQMDPRIRLVRRPVNGGMAEAFNTGYRHATGEFHTRLAQDDLFEPHAVASFVDFMRHHPEVGLAYADCHVFVDRAAETLRYYPTSPPELLFRNETCIGLCLFWRRTLWDKLGGFDGRWDTAEDYDFSRRAHEITPLGKCEQGGLVRVRLHSHMSTLAYRAKQQIRQAQIDARYCGSRREAREVLCRGFCNAGFEHSLRHKFLPAVSCYLRAILHRPGHFAAYRGLASLVLQPFRSLEASVPGPASLLGGPSASVSQPPGNASPTGPCPLYDHNQENRP